VYLYILKKSLFFSLVYSIVIASKFTSDIFYANSRYAKVGGIPLRELNQLELEFLFLIDFQLHIKLEDLQDYADQLLLHAMSLPTAAAAAAAAATAEKSSTTVVLRQEEHTSATTTTTNSILINKTNTTNTIASNITLPLTPPYKPTIEQEKASCSSRKRILHFHPYQKEQTAKKRLGLVSPKEDEAL
jgi:hypothetical protein